MKNLKKRLVFEGFWHIGKIASKRQLDLQNNQLGTNLGPTWGQLVLKMEPRRAKMELRRAKLGPSWAKLNQFGPTWDQVRLNLGPSGPLGSVLAQLEDLCWIFGPRPPWHGFEPALGRRQRRTPIRS